MTDLQTAPPAPAAAPAPVTVAACASAEAIAAYRAAARPGLPAPASAAASPVHTFVLGHTAADRTVRALCAGEEFSVVHLGQDIRLTRPVRPGEPVTVTVDTLGARQEARGLRVAIRSRLYGAGDGEGAEPFAELVTAALLVGGRGAGPFGSLPAGTPPPAAGAPGEPVTVTHELTRDSIGAYARASADLNPIHTDDEAARAAGFDTVIAHGMSVVALVVEEVADRYAGGDVTRVRALGGRFSAPVPPGVPLDIALQPDEAGRTVRFTCRTPAGPAVKSGWIEIAPESAAQGGGGDD
ncbi:MaoC family dehydratase [Streptomyces sp. ODS05-4]|uniref:MaoC family dehydratase n=1 Tax=Streptomyces sp. ODS05-4 TaxID=2944939 RepID=UPI00210BDABB|nr:MaoC family dehydratase [Streptomyces sp. ODS05-4]